jgi:hypothetical protein
MKLDPGALGYDTDAGKGFLRRVVATVETQPGVRAASLIEKCAVAIAIRQSARSLKKEIPIHCLIRE